MGTTFKVIMIRDGIYGNGERVTLAEFNSFREEQDAWSLALKKAESAVDKRELPYIVLYDTRMHHRAAYFVDRYDREGNLVAEKGWYNPRNEYHKIEVDNPEW